MCRVPGWYLNFDVEGFPFFEPCFASIGRTPWPGAMDSSVELEAAAHRITPKDFVRIQRTEGGGGHAGIGYDPAEIDVVLRDGRNIKTVTLLHKTRANNFFAHPSRRYHNLIVNGAKESKMSPAYIAYLEATPVYERPESLLFNVLLLFCLGPYFIFIAAPVLLMYYLSSRLSFGGKRHAPRILHVALHFILDISYILHNNVWVHILGNGYYSGGKCKQLLKSSSSNLCGQ